MTELKFKHTCECTQCGNEAEMLVTCSLQEEASTPAKPRIVPAADGKIIGQAACSQCGGEADIWLEI